MVERYDITFNDLPPIPPRLGVGARLYFNAIILRDHTAFTSVGIAIPEIKYIKISRKILSKKILHIFNVESIKFTIFYNL